MNTVHLAAPPNDTREPGPKPDVIPAVELRGSTKERLTSIDAAIARLQGLRQTLAGDQLPAMPPYELHGRHINAPVWPWFTAGCLLGALCMLLFLLAWTYA